jgi:hypothetical protein
MRQSDRKRGIEEHLVALLQIWRRIKFCQPLTLRIGE